MRHAVFPVSPVPRKLYGLQVAQPRQRQSRSRLDFRGARDDQSSQRSESSLVTETFEGDCQRHRWRPRRVEEWIELGWRVCHKRCNGGVRQRPCLTQGPSKPAPCLVLPRCCKSHGRALTNQTFLLRHGALR